MKFEHHETIQFEPVRVTLEITNEGDEPFIVARDVKRQPEMNFHIVKEGRRTVTRRQEGGMLSNLYILPGRKETLHIVLSRWYNLTDMGQYLATATIDWNGEDYTSNRGVLDVVRGMEIASATVAMPGRSRQRLHCGLRYWRRNREEHLFLVIQDAAGDVSYGVYPIGPILRISKPRIETDSQGRIMTVHQTSPNCYVHGVFQVGPNGSNVVRQRLLTANGQPCPGDRDAQQPPASAR